MLINYGTLTSNIVFKKMKIMYLPNGVPFDDIATLSGIFLWTDTELRDGGPSESNSRAVGFLYL